MRLVNEGAPTASAANCASGGPVPTPRPPGGGPATAGAAAGKTCGSSAAGAGISGGSLGAATTSVGCVAAPELGAGFGAGGLGTKTRGGGISWAALPAAPAVHAAKQVPSRIILPFMGGS